MDPPPQPPARFYRRLDDRLPQYIAEFDQPQPVCLVDFSDDHDHSDARLRYLYEQTNRKQTRSGSCGLLAAYFSLGRALSSLGSRTALRLLRRWTAHARANHVYRTAIRTYEVFAIKGPEYIFLSSLSATILREMPAETYSIFLGAVQAQALTSRLTEQTSLEGNSVTAHGVAEDLRP
jgi:hypothetical protein